MNTDSFVSINLNDIIVGEDLPCSVYLYIDFRFITFRGQGDSVDRNAFDRLQFKKVKSLFIQEADRGKFETWITQRVKEDAAVDSTPQPKAFAEAREDAYRKAMDIFQSEHPDKMVKAALSTSKTLVKELMAYPYAIKSLGQLQTYSRGTVDHSVNVSILATYLAMQIGYTHKLILQHVGVGGLLHDIGKTQIPIEETDTAEVIESKMRAHPEVGGQLLDNQTGVPKEVKMIVLQHHEYFDGTGYPHALRGNSIYDLARIVTIANEFDEMVSAGKGTLAERQRNAVRIMDQEKFKKFDPQKLNKCIKILKLGV